MSDRGTGVPTGTAPATRGAQPGTTRQSAPGGSVMPGTVDRSGRIPGVTTIPGAGPTDAQAALRAELEQWGLGSLVDWAWQKLTTGASPDQIIYELRQQDAYKQRFAGNVERQKAGLTPLSEANYLAYEEQARQMFQYYGLPKTFYDQPEDFAKFIGGDVSVTELHDRVVAGSNALLDTPEDQRAWARYYGVTDGQQLSYMLDPQRSVPILQRQQAAAQAGGAAQQAGFGDLSQVSAERLAALGITQAQAQQGFTQLAGQKEITGAIIGDTGAGMTEAAQVGAQFGGDAAAQQALSRRQRGRLSQFAGSGGYVSTTGGDTGVGPPPQ